MEKSNLKVAIVGLGYVGLPLTALFLRKGWDVFGIDIDESKIQNLKQRKSYLSDFSDQDIDSLFCNGSFFPGTSFDVIAQVNVIILCVPTPLTEDYQPELKYLRSAIESCKPHIQRGQLIVLESSTYPGTTEDEICPMVKSQGLTVGKDFYIAYSPERIDPGNTTLELTEIPKLVGGITKKCTEYARDIYQTVFQKVHCVSSAKVAEMSKLVENSQRLINISFMNELLSVCDVLNIELWEVIDAASTKPFGFTPYYPGPGIGGHCIPIDPLYLLWKAKKYNHNLNLIRIANEINEQMPSYVVGKIEKSLNNTEGLKDSRILIIGVAYKRNVNDVRESSALPIIKLLIQKGAIVEYFDPYIPKVKINEITLLSTDISSEKISQADCTVILTDHSNIDYKQVLHSSKLVIDTRNATKGLENNGNVIKL